MNEKLWNTPWKIFLNQLTFLEDAITFLHDKQSIDLPKAARPQPTCSCVAHW